MNGASNPLDNGAHASTILGPRDLAASLVIRPKFPLMHHPNSRIQYFRFSASSAADLIQWATL